MPAVTATCLGETVPIPFVLRLLEERVCEVIPKRTSDRADEVPESTTPTGRLVALTGLDVITRLTSCDLLSPELHLHHPAQRRAEALILGWYILPHGVLRELRRRDARLDAPLDIRLPIPLLQHG